LHIGCSGWSYKHWKELLYPAGLKTTEWFGYYATLFDCVEINTSFYHLPKEQTVINWAAKAPPGYLFCPKLSRYITHMKKLRGVEEPLERFFTIFEPLQAFMGPVLVQLPPMLKFNYEVAEAFFSLLKKAYGRYDYVLEVRHDSWLSDESLVLLTQYEVGLVISQSGGFFPYSEAITAPNIYLRFHGPAELYASPYSDEMLAAYAHKIRQWTSEGYSVWAFFNNDIHGHAFRDAQRLKTLLGG
jgi:uncharacterized protein YecE (DUF72 family)